MYYFDLIAVTNTEAYWSEMFPAEYYLFTFDQGFPMCVLCKKDFWKMQQ